MKKIKSVLSFWHPASLICTYFGIGKIPFAPGTWGSLFAIVPLFFFAEYILPLTIILFFLGWYCSNIYEEKSGEHDSKQIVIDEVVGMFVAFIVFENLLIIFETGLTVQQAYLAMLSIFITFRIFDIVKRGAVGWVDRNIKGGLGVMLDDVVAGVLAGASSALIFLAI